MTRAADRFVEVELVEADVVDGRDGPVDPPVPPLWSALAHVPREVVLTAVAALLLAGTGVGVARVGADRALVARLAQMPGAASSRADPWEVAWRTPSDGLIALPDDLVVPGDDDGSGAVATDLRDGSTRCTLPGTCQLTPTEGDVQHRFTGVGSAFEALPDAC